MSDREEVACRVAEKLGFKPDPPLGDIDLQWSAREIWDALISSEMRVEELVRIAHVFKNKVGFLALTDSSYDEFQAACLALEEIEKAGKEVAR